MKIDPALFPTIEGSTDSELMFRLALTFGLEQSPLPALERMAGIIEDIAARHRVDLPLNMTVCVTDGEQIIAVRYSSERQSRSLFHSTSFRHLHELYPHNPRIAEAGDDAFMVLSEPLVDLRGAWEEIPESTAIIARGGDVEQRPFEPRRHA